jgi:hypothetical protein
MTHENSFRTFKQMPTSASRRVWEGKAEHYNLRQVKSSIAFGDGVAGPARRPSLGETLKNARFPLRAAQYCTKIQSDPITAIRNRCVKVDSHACGP